MGHDVVVIGAGLSGLTNAILLAESGRRVLVLEQHAVPGGYLQQFQRKGTRFDVGFHWVGSTRPGRPLHRTLSHLGIFDRLQWRPLPREGAIEYRSSSRRFVAPPRFDDFVERARATWPGDREAVDRFVREVEETCALFKWFDLDASRAYDDPVALKISPRSLADQVSEYVSDPWLAEFLRVQSYNLGLTPEEVPWTKNALVFRSNFDDTSQLAGGGGELVDALVERGGELGVEYRLRSGVTGLECEGRRVTALRTAAGDRIESDLFIASCHPKEVLRLLPDGAMTPLFRNRLLAMRDSRGALQVFLRLRRPLTTLITPCLLLAGGPPLGPVLVTMPEPLRVELLAYQDQAPYMRWRGMPAMRRGAEYESVKRGFADLMLKRVTEAIPELSEAIDDLYAATPVTDEWYTRNEHGAVFGISHDIGQQGLDRPTPRQRLRNLWYTGHSIQMPGIIGVVLNAFGTSQAIRGDGWLFDQVAS